MRFVPALTMIEDSMQHAQRSTIAPELGRYRLIAELARGGMGNVYLAVAQGPGGFNKLLAVKELKPELCDDEVYVQMFLDEARLAARLQHPNVVQTNEVGSEGKRHFMVMEFLDGRSLHRLSRVAKLPVGARVRVIAESLLGLHYAHELRDFDGGALGIVHRDVSPLNVFVTFAGQAKVLDFGIAKTADSSQETKTGVLKGRVAYMAPEQAWGGKVDRRADLYSMGVMLWEAAAGRRLWRGMTEVQILSRAMREGAPRLRSVCPDAPVDLDAICARAMEREPEQRYATAKDLFDDLEAHLSTRDDAPSMREIGALAASSFAEERAKMRAVIEETLSFVRSAPRSGVMPTFEAHLAGGTKNSDSPLRDASGAISGHIALTPAPSSEMSRSYASAMLSVAPPSSGPLSSPVVSTRPPEDGRTAAWKRMTAFASAAVVLLGLSAALAVSLHRSAEPPPAGNAILSTAGVGATHPSGEVELPVREAVDAVDLVVRVTPAGAKITVDGVTVATNPYHARLPKDGQTHHIMAFADGYDPKLEDVSFASDVSVDVSLEKHSTGPPRTVTVYVPRGPSHASKPDPAPAASPDPAASPSPAPPPPPPDTTTAAGHAPLHSIVTSNPYGKP